MNDQINLTPAYIAAQAVALNARTNMLTDHMVDDMREKAEELLPRDHPMRAEIIMFATQYMELKRDAYAMRLLGENLETGLHNALNIRKVKEQWQDQYD